MVEIPLVAYPSRKFQIVLNDQDCTIKLYQKGKNVYVDLEVNTTPVIAGAICLNNKPIIIYAQSLFKGNMLFIDVQGNGNPQWDGLGTRWKLIYYSDDKELLDV